MALPADNRIRDSALRPHVWMINTTGGNPQLPQTVNVDDGGTPTPTSIWDRFYPCTVGGFPAREYRNSAGDRLCVAVRVAAITLPDTRTGALVIAWLPVPSRGSASTPLWDAIENSINANLVRSWPCDLDVDGTTWLVSAMDAAAGPAAVLAQANWPPLWRKMLVTDPPGVGAIPPGPPTGARVIGAVIAS